MGTVLRPVPLDCAREKIFVISDLEIPHKIEGK